MEDGWKVRMNICTALWSFVNFCGLSQSEVQKIEKLAPFLHSNNDVCCRCCYRSYVDRFLKGQPHAIHYIFENLKCFTVVEASLPFGPVHFFRVVTLVLIVWHNFIFLCRTRPIMINTNSIMTARYTQISSWDIFISLM